VAAAPIAVMDADTVPTAAVWTAGDEPPPQAVSSNANPVIPIQRTADIR
jgi:hypothetical protein